MSEVVDQSLRKIAKGALITLIGTGVGTLLSLVSKPIMVRYITQTDYGNYSLALVIANVFALISILGLDVGLARQIAFYRGRENESKIRKLIFASLLIALVSSVFFSIVLFCASDLISTKIFHNADVPSVLKTFCIAIPFLVLGGFLATIFRGFEKAGPNAYFQYILRNSLFLLLLVVAIALNLQFTGVIWAYVLCSALTLIIFLVYAIKKPPFKLSKEGFASVSKVGKELIVFSLPLFAIGVADNILTWADTLMLGFFKMPADVGLYNVALPLAYFLPIFLSATAFVYFPLMTHLYAKSQMDEIRRSYAVLSKWIFFATLPIFLILFLFPEATLNVFFGYRYVGAASALQILSIGLLFHAIFGTAGYALVAIGRNRLVMWSELIAVIISVVLNIALILPYGIKGAAIATASAFAVRSLIWLVGLYSITKIHPFTKNYLKPLVAAVILVIIVNVLVKSLFESIPFWLLPVLFIAFLGICALSILVTKSFDREDVKLLLSIEEKIGINMRLLKKVVKKFQ